MSIIELTINGRVARAEVAPRTHLADYLRDGCNLTGTHLGCEHGVCGACTVLLDGDPVRSCITFAVACEGREVRTIEGFEDDALMARLRRSFSTHHGLQCGFCTPGMLITARDIVRRLPDADEARIRTELSGNLCRCTGYVGIVAAIRAVLADLKLNPCQIPGAAEAKSTLVPVAPRSAALEFRTFEATQVASPATSIGAAAADAAESARGRKGWTAIDDSFVVPFPLQRVWALMGDLPQVAACLPGAELLEHDEEKVRGRVVVSFGPMSASFTGAARLQRDESAHRAVMRGAGQDNISRSRASGDVTYALSEEAGGAQTRLTVRLEYMLQGPLAQFSRSGLVKDFARRMIADFGERVCAQLGGTREHGGSAAAAPVHAGALFWSVIWHRIKQLFRWSA